MVLPMNSNQYQSLKIELQKISTVIPLTWGAVQNDATDKLINLFSIQSYADLCHKIQNLPDVKQQYFMHRWFLWQCARCDEHIFATNGNVKPNPNPRDQTYDIEFNGNPGLRFDIKSTKVPKQFRSVMSTLFRHPEQLVNFFYTYQSTGVRNCRQNRIFIVHHSFVSTRNTLKLRCQWDFKEKTFTEYAGRVTNKAKFIKHSDVKSDIIFIIENRDGSLARRFVAV
jgi:hypothetical protein